MPQCTPKEAEEINDSARWIISNILNYERWKVSRASPQLFSFALQLCQGLLTQLNHLSSTKRIIFALDEKNSWKIIYSSNRPTETRFSPSGTIQHRADELTEANWKLFVIVNDGRRVHFVLNCEKANILFTVQLLLCLKSKLWTNIPWLWWSQTVQLYFVINGQQIQNAYACILGNGSH